MNKCHNQNKCRRKGFKTCQPNYVSDLTNEKDDVLLPYLFLCIHDGKRILRIRNRRLGSWL